MGLRLAWGGGAQALWEGVIAVSEGTLSEPRPLGIEADEPGSIWLEWGPVPAVAANEGGEFPSAPRQMHHLVIRQRSPRVYDGVDLLVTAPLEAELLARLSKSGAQEEPRWIRIPLADLADDSHTANLDEEGNWLLVSRTPGDRLRVTVPHRSLVFDPGETLSFRLQPHLSSVEPDSRVRIKIELMEGRSSRGRLVAEHTLLAGGREPIEQPVHLPDEEGVYDVVITATHAGWLRRTQPFRGKEPLAIRKIQVLVLSRQAPDVPEAAAARWQKLEEIDPANPKWWERFAKLPHLGRLPRLWKGPLGNGYSKTWEHSLGQLVRLGPSQDPGDVAWEAYTLPIQQPGRPHLLEVDCPGDVPQTMGISIIEPNAKGGVFPIGLDSGIELASELAGAREDRQWRRHRLVFWPKTKSPVVLITDQRDTGPAVYGEIRVYSAGEHLPRAFPAQGPRPQRLLAAYLDRPLFPENFAASESVDTSSKLGADDWVTFYQGGTRLVEYLNHVGFGGLMISVLADGSTIYPSAVLEPTPRYDTGAFQDAGQDPVRKDVLEMLFRLFDREGLKLIPAMEFAAPLPDLEDALRRGGAESVGLVWIGPHGKSWLETYRRARQMAPYYNVLHPRVQATMLAAVRELVGSYAHHPSFDGLALHLSAHGYAQLPGPGWGMDDWTIAEFERETGIRVPAEGPQRFAERARFLSSQCPKEWLAWRADRLAEFHRRIQAELAAVRPGARLYLAGANMLAGEELERDLMPALPRRITIADAMLRVGVDPEHYAEDQGVVLLRPERIGPRWSLAERAVDLEIQQMLQAQKADLTRPFEGMAIPGSLFFHESREIRVASFDEQSPFRPTYASLVSQPAPLGAQNRRRFVRSLAALDSQVLFDGGSLLPLGQEESVRDLVAAYRQLPSVRFQRLTDPSGADPAQPVTIRYATYANGTYVYLVNNAPFPSTVRIEVNAPTGCRVEELRSWRQVPPIARDAGATYWTVELEPYDLAAVRFSAPGVRLSRPLVRWPPEVQAALESRIADLYDRTAALRRPPALDVLTNPGFEDSPTDDAPIPGWTTTAGPDGSVELDSRSAWGGTQAVHMTSPGAPVSLISQPFDPPSTGRLTMSVRLRGGDAAQRPFLRYRLEGQRRGADFRRWQVRQVGPAWEPFVVEASDLPLQGLSQVRIHFDLMGPGEVWIDEVQLCAVAFNPTEMNELFKLISPANFQLQNGQVHECLQLLEGYWPRFLVDNVPLAELPVVQKPDSPPRPAEEPQKTSPGVLDRIKGFVPRKLSLF